MAKKMENYLKYIAVIYRDNGKEHGNYYSIYRGYIGIMEKNMETTIVYIFGVV